MNRMLNVSINYLGFCETGPSQARSRELFRNFYHKKHGKSELYRVPNETVALGPHNMSILGLQQV